MFNITSKYFSIFNNKPPASWVAHITRDFITCYSCSYYSFMIEPTCFKWINPLYWPFLTSQKQPLSMKSRNFITDIWDFNVFTTSIMKSTYIKANPKIAIYRNCKNLNSSKTDLEISLLELPLVLRGYFWRH